MDSLNKIFHCRDLDKLCVPLLSASIKHQDVAFIGENMRTITNSESMEKILNLYWDLHF